MGLNVMNGIKMVLIRKQSTRLIIVICILPILVNADGFIILKYKHAIVYHVCHIVIGAILTVNITRLRKMPVVKIVGNPTVGTMISSIFPGGGACLSVGNEKVNGMNFWPIVV